MATKPEDRNYSRIEIYADYLTFNAFGPDGKKTASTDIYLSAMIQDGDHHGLLLQGIFMQLAHLNASLDEQKKAMAERSSSAGGEEMLDKTIQRTLSQMQKAGVPGMESLVLNLKEE